MGGLGGPALAGGLGTGAVPGSMNDLAAAAASGGGPSNFGKVGDAALADADPLGVNTSVTFDDVGGLDERKLPNSAMAGMDDDFVLQISTV